MTTPFAYHEHPPAPPVAASVLSYWAFEASGTAPEPTEHTVWPDGCTSLAVAIVPGARPQLLCIGATADARRLPVTPGARYVGVRFWPDTGAACTGYPASLLRDALLPVPTDFVASWSVLAESVATVPHVRDAWPLLDAWTATLSPRIAPDALVRQCIHAVAAAAGDVRVAALAASLGPSARTLQRRFAAATGLTVKEYARIRRLRTALEARLKNADGAWSVLAAELGYADQSHLVREFSALCGQAPRAADAHLARIAHHDARP